jgi:murein DD-endopeptidase MepM/ murein hydrolase activator NlpD
MQANAIRHPRDLYPGQTLSLPGSVSGPDAVQPLTLAWGEDFDLVARRAGRSRSELARANGLLHPGLLSLGMRLVGPAGLPARGMTPPSEAAPRVGSAVLEGVPLWEVLWLNPDPIPLGGRLLVPGADPADSWVLDLSVAPQPVPRGQTAVVRLVTTEPVSCTVAYLDRVEACYPSGADSEAVPAASVSYAFLGLPALLPPGDHVALLTLAASSGEVEVPVSLRVSPGRFDYERIDLPPDRQSLLDPARTQAERETIAALRTVRSPQRRWTLPFLAPLQGSITSYYGSRRSYGHGFSSYHAGADFQAATGAPVVAPASGRVILAEPLVVRGNAVMIDHGWGVTTGYWHLSAIDVAVGQEVAAGARIGAVGNTGLSTGSHLHWELWVNGIAVDPLPWLEAAPGAFEALVGGRSEGGP